MRLLAVFLPFRGECLTCFGFWGVNVVLCCLRTINFMVLYDAVTNCSNRSFVMRGKLYFSRGIWLNLICFLLDYVVCSIAILLILGGSSFLFPLCIHLYYIFNKLLLERIFPDMLEMNYYDTRT